MKAIIVSKKDVAGMHMRKFFLDNHCFKETGEEFDGNPVHKKGDFRLYLINQFQTHADYIDSIDTELFIFASRHTGREPSLTAHPIGNFGAEAKLGGKPFTLVKTAPFIMRSYLEGLARRKEGQGLPQFVSYEATHHGPCLSRPAVYVEVGGQGEKEWNDLKACEAVADTIVNDTKPSGSKVALGFGDLHYPHHFTKHALAEDIAFSHMVSKHACPDFTEKMLDQMIACSPRVDLAFVDWKSLKSEKHAIFDSLSARGIEAIKIRKRKK